MPDALVRGALIAAYRLLRIWWFVRRPSHQGAFVAVWHGERMLLVRNSYRPGETVPCGGIHRGETPRAAAVRELREEVGIEAREDELIEVGTWSLDFQHKRDRAHFFEIRLEHETTPRVDRREVVWAGFCPASELHERPLVPHVRAYLAERSPDEPMGL